MTQPRTPDMVFVSPAKPEDNDFARWLALQLANEGYPVWCDLTRLLGGEKFWEDVQNAITNRTVKFLSALSAFQHEIRHARRTQLRPWRRKEIQAQGFRHHTQAG